MNIHPICCVFINQCNQSAIHTLNYIEYCLYLDYKYTFEAQNTFFLCISILPANICNFIYLFEIIDKTFEQVVRCTGETVSN